MKTSFELTAFSPLIQALSPKGEGIYGHEGSEYMNSKLINKNSKLI
jgi:hypothetical protein